MPLNYAPKQISQPGVKMENLWKPKYKKNLEIPMKPQPSKKSRGKVAKNFFSTFTCSTPTEKNVKNDSNSHILSTNAFTHSNKKH